MFAKNSDDWLVLGVSFRLLRTKLILAWIEILWARLCG